MDRRMSDYKMERMKDNKYVHNSSSFPLVGLQINVCSNRSTSNKVLFVSWKERERNCVSLDVKDNWLEIIIQKD